MIGHASEPLFSSLERVEKGRACCCRRRGASVAPYTPRYSCCCCCSIPTMNTQRLSYIAQLHKIFVLQQSSGWITDQTCIASIMGSTTFWRLNFWMHILFLGLSYQNNLAQIIHINNNDWDWTLLFAISAFALTGTTVLLLNIMMSYWL